jgi:hypothetical protein
METAPPAKPFKKEHAECSDEPDADTATGENNKFGLHPASGKFDLALMFHLHPLRMEHLRIGNPVGHSLSPQPAMAVSTHVAINEASFEERRTIEEEVLRA